MPFPYSLFNGLQAPQQNYPINRTDLLDYKGSNTIQSARFIDPQTGDFVVSSTNHFEGMNAVDQAVLLAVNTTFNTSAQPSFGQNFQSIKLITGNVKVQMTAILQQCLAYLIQTNQITISNILVSQTDIGEVSMQFSYTNSTTGNTTPISFIAQQG
jgi:hypothetical protein